jgi:hypothetical protein
MVREELLRAVIKPKFNLCIIQRKTGRGAGGGTEKRGGAGGEKGWPISMEPNYFSAITSFV